MKTLKSLLGSAGIGSLRRMKRNELVQAAATVRKALRSRASTFAKHDAEAAFPFEDIEDLPTAADFENRSELLSWLSDALKFLNKPEESTYRGYMAAVNARMAAYNETLNQEGRKGFDTLEDFNRFGKFMGEAQERFRDFSVVSDQVVEMYDQAERLGVDPEQFMRNFDYWKTHLEDLQDATPIEWQRKGKPVYASDYARQLHLPRMKDFYKDNEKKILRKRRRRK